MSADRNNNELLNNLGNFVNRALKFIYDRFEHCVPGVASAATERETSLVDEVRLSVGCRGGM